MSNEEFVKSAMPECIAEYKFRVESVRKCIAAHVTA